MLFDSPNHFDVTQFVVLALSVTLFDMSFIAYRRAPAVRGFALAMMLIGFVSVLFYTVVIVSPVDELYPDMIAFASGIRSAFVYTVLIGIVWMWIKFYNEHKSP